MTTACVEHWLEGLGYTDEPQLLHRTGETVSPKHPYALEIDALLDPDGSVRARAVFDVEGVPTIVFLDGDIEGGAAAQALDDARQRIWNQNLATIVLHVRGNDAIAVPARKLETAEQHLRIEQVRRDGPFSASDVVSANLTRRVPEWFERDARVDKKLLDNISTTVDQLTRDGFDGVDDERQRRQYAQLLMGEILFVSYLEHRKIVSHTYRKERDVGCLHDLVRDDDRDGVQRLIESLRSDFNGDFLAEDSHDPWTVLAERGFKLLDQFLSRMDMRTGQGDFWNYDFSYIPVELLSGLYEMFLSPGEQYGQGAFYTPRHLAALAVHQAFSHSRDPLVETIFDGACGSGILLTTAYRRLIALSEQAQGRQLAFSERSALLKRTIFGGDTNAMACRVTAFSLYLSMFEGLDPADIMAAQKRDAAQLPTLKGSNLASGPDAGDFFKETHAFAGKRFSLVISNPPWREPERTERTTADAWFERTGEPFARRQIAGAYALRTLDFLKPRGRACLILPIGQLLGDTSAKFVARLLHRYQPLSLINFGDLQELLFPTARHACHVFTAQRRADDPAPTLPFRETFEYCVPKADLTLALGHLTMQSADLHRLQTISIVDEPRQLVSRMWGDANDVALWTRLTARGTFEKFTRPKEDRPRRACRKGITATATGNTPVPDELSALPYIDPEALNIVSPVLHRDLLREWPPDKHLMNPPSDALMRVFNGPRVVFPDGFSQTAPNVRAYYYEGPAAFTHSIGVIASSHPGDAPLLKFVSVYLRSTLARYFLMMHTWKILCSRGGFHLRDIKAFPYFEPNAAPDPAKARNALESVAQHMDEIAGLSVTEQPSRYHDLRGELDRYVYAYFGLTRVEQELVEETVDFLIPSIRPASLDALDTPAQQNAHLKDYMAYANTLGASLTRWRTKLRGEGSFRVTMLGSEPRRDGPSGVARVDYDQDATADPEIKALVNDDTVLQILASLRNAGLRRIRSGDPLSLVPDTHIWLEGSLYLVRPATKRSWTIRQALRDAENIVRLIQSDFGT